MNYIKSTLRTLAVVAITMQLMAVMWHKADQNTAPMPKAVMAWAAKGGK